MKGIKTYSSTKRDRCYRQYIKTKWGYQVQTLLASLGPEYEIIRTAINASGISEFEDVISRLRQAEDRIQEQNPGVYPSEGNLARMTTAKKNYGVKKVKCYYCGD